MTETKPIKPKGNKKLIAGFFAGVLGGVLTWLVTDYLSVKQEQLMLSSITVDSFESIQGRKSLRWDFALQPEKRYLFSPIGIVGGLFHLEVLPDKKGNIKGLNLSKYDEILFYAKASHEMLIVNEFNIFTGQDYIQYIGNPNKPFLLSTKWSEYRFSLKGFKVAQWDYKYRYHLIDKKYLSSPDLANVTGLGFDLKTDDRVLSGSIWIDYIRLRATDGTEVTLSEANDIDFEFFGRQLRWISGAREYP